MTFQTITTESAPAPVGAYSQGRRVGSFLQVSGQLSVEPAGDVAGQTRRALEQVRAVLDADGADWSDVLMVRVHLAADEDFDAMDAAYSEMLPVPYPPRTTVTSVLAPGALVEIDVLAARA